MHGKRWWDSYLDHILNVWLQIYLIRFVGLRGWKTVRVGRSLIFSLSSAHESKRKCKYKRIFSYIPIRKLLSQMLMFRWQTVLIWWHPILLTYYCYYYNHNHSRKFHPLPLNKCILLNYPAVQLVYYNYAFTTIFWIWLQIYRMSKSIVSGKSWEMEMDLFYINNLIENMNAIIIFMRGGINSCTLNQAIYNGLSLYSTVLLRDPWWDFIQ